MPKRVGLSLLPSGIPQRISTSSPFAMNAQYPDAYFAGVLLEKVPYFDVVVFEGSGKSISVDRGVGCGEV